MRKITIIGFSAVAFAAILWSLDGVLIRPRLNNLPPTFIVFFEHLLGLFLLSPILYFNRDKLKTISIKHWIVFFAVALFGGVLGTLAFTKALFLSNFKNLSAIILLQKLQPVFAIFLARILLKEKFQFRFYLYAFFAIILGYFITFPDWRHPIDNLQSARFVIVLLAILAAVFWGGATTLGKLASNKINYKLLTAIRFALTVLILLPFVMLFYRNSFYDLTNVNLLYFIVIALSSGAGAMYIYYYGLRKIPASLATIAELAWPVSAIFFDYFFNGNLMSSFQIFATIILFGLVYLILKTPLNK